MIKNKVLNLLENSEIPVSVPEILKKTIDQFLGQALAFIIAVVTLWYIDVYFALALMVWVLQDVMHGVLIYGK